jgi:hypothetical protein
MAARVQRFLQLLGSSLRWLLLLGCLGSQHARADDVASVALDLDAGATCLQADLLRQSLGGWLRQSVDHAAFTVQVRGSVDDPRSVTIVLSRAGQPLSQRAFRPGPPRCTDFHDAVALAIALMLKNADAPEGTVRAQPADDPPPAEPPAAPTEHNTVAPALIAPPPRVPAPREASPALFFSPRASALFARHEASSTAAGARVELAFGIGARWSLHAGMLGLFSTSQVLKPFDGAQADGQVRYRTRPLLASLLGCAALFGGATVRVSGCAGVLTGRVQFAGQRAAGTDSVAASTVAWTALQAQLEFALRLGQRGWVFLAVLPTYGLRQLGTTALDARGAVAAQDRLPRLGALFALGLAFDFSAKALAPRGMNE